MLGYYKKERIKMYLRRGLVLLSVYAVLFLTLFFVTPIERFLNGNLFFYADSYAKAQCRVHFLDVGQGDCTFVELNNGGTTIMIDTGKKSAGKEILKYMSLVGYGRGSRIDYLILTHTDSDHVGGAKTVMENFDVKSVFVPMIYSTFDVENGFDSEDYYVDSSSLWAEVRKSIVENVGLENIFYSFAGKSVLGMNFSLDFYAPYNEKPCGEEVSSTNNYSPVLILNASGMSTMFVGDIDSECESEFLDYYRAKVENGDLDVDVLKIAHHGSKNSSSKAFLDAVSPEYAVISCGESNSYNHANDDTINRLVEINADIFRTDIEGSIILTSGSTDTITAFCDFYRIGSAQFSWLGIVVTFVVVSFLIFVFSIRISTEPQM